MPVHPRPALRSRLLPGPTARTRAPLVLLLVVVLTAPLPAAAVRAHGRAAPAAPGRPVAAHGRFDPPVPTDGRYRLPVDAGGDVVRAFERPPERWAAGHRGVDLAAAPGSVVRAPAAGTVTYAGAVAGRGVVTVTHGDGLRSSFEPVVPSVAVGASVAAGDPVATVAADGSHCGDAACVHWGVRRGTEYLDPMTLLADGPIVLLPPG